MQQYIDLSHTLKNEMAVHPYDDELKLYRNRFLDKDKYNDSRLETSMHVGTHVDVPSHLIDRKIFVSDFPLVKFIGNGCLLDVRNQDVITMKKEYLDIVNRNDIVLLYTGYGKKFGNDDYYSNHPVVDKELADFFVNKGIKMLGMDIPSPDKPPFEIHKLLLKKDILIIENLVNLEKITDVKNFEVIALPLKIKAEGSPIRVVARF